MLVKKTTVLVALMGIIVSTSVRAQDENDLDDKVSVGLSLNQDAFFGFNPMMTIGYELSDTDALTMYGIQWGAGTGSAWGQWTEIGDGIVPNLTINLGTDLLEGQFYLGYYAAFRDNTQAGQSTNNYLHYWLNLGLKASDFFSVGAHFEELYLSGGETNGGGSLDRVDGYVWLGPYVQFQKGNAGLRFSFGGNLADEDERFAPNDFYKLTFFLSL